MSSAIPPQFWQGVEQFNQRDFYACHDTLEALWMEASEPEKKFYQGVLQISVALYHLSDRNWRGAAILLGEGISRLRDYQPSYFGIYVDILLQDSNHILKALQESGPDNIAEFASQLFDSDRPASSGDISAPPLPRIVLDASKESDSENGC